MYLSRPHAYIIDCHTQVALDKKLTCNACKRYKQNKMNYENLRNYNQSCVKKIVVLKPCSALPVSGNLHYYDRYTVYFLFSEALQVQLQMKSSTILIKPVFFFSVDAEKSN